MFGLAGVGDASLGEWVDVTEIAVHLRRRLLSVRSCLSAGRRYPRDGRSGRASGCDRETVSALSGLGPGKK